MHWSAVEKLVFARNGRLPGCELTIAVGTEWSCFSAAATGWGATRRQSNSCCERRFTHIGGFNLRATGGRRSPLRAQQHGGAEHDRRILSRHATILADQSVWRRCLLVRLLAADLHAAIGLDRRI